jgi:hypothetical protein
MKEFVIFRTYVIPYFSICCISLINVYVLSPSIMQQSLQHSPFNANTTYFGHRQPPEQCNSLDALKHLRMAVNSERVPQCITYANTGSTNRNTRTRTEEDRWLDQSVRRMADCICKVRIDLIAYTIIGEDIISSKLRSSLRHYTTSRKVAGSIPSEETEFFNWPNHSSCKYGPVIDSASNRNEYQEFSWGKGRQARKADNFTAICE